MAAKSGWQLRGSGPEAYERDIVPAFMGTWAKNPVERAALYRASVSSMWLCWPLTPSALRF